MSMNLTLNTTINYNTPSQVALMNVVRDVTASLTMSSREIAELTGKRHDHVIRDIRNMFEALEITAPKFGGYYKSKRNRDLVEYLLPKRETLILVSGYNIKLRAAIIDRWLELEEQALNPSSLMQNKDYLQAYIPAQEDITNQLTNIINEHLHSVTVDEWRALNHKYLPLSLCQQLGKLATRLCQEADVLIGKQQRIFQTKTGTTRKTYINVYPVEILDEAAELLGLLS